VGFSNPETINYHSDGGLMFTSFYALWGLFVVSTALFLLVRWFVDAQTELSKKVRSARK
jgi:hypothetical protein